MKGVKLRTRVFSIILVIAFLLPVMQIAWASEEDVVEDQTQSTQESSEAKQPDSNTNKSKSINTYRTEPSINIKALNTSGGTLATPWDYVTNYQYTTVVAIDPEGTGSNRQVIITAPEGMRFVTPSGFPAGITSIVYNVGYTSGAEKGKELLVSLDNTTDALVTFSMLTIGRGSVDTASQQTTVKEVGSVIWDAGVGGKSVAPESITKARSVGTWGGETPTGTYTIPYKVYSTDHMFDGLYLADYYNYNTDTYVKTYAIMNWWKQILHNNGTSSNGSYWRLGVADKNGWGIWNRAADFFANPHQPYWDLSIKVYIPEGLEVTNPSYTVQTDEIGNYVQVEKINQEPLHANGLSRQKNPLAGGKTTTSGHPSIGTGLCYDTTHLDGAVYLANLGLVLDATETISPGKVYSTEGKTIVSYKVYDETGKVKTITQELNPPEVRTEAYKNIDGYTKTAQAIGVNAGWKGNTFSDLPSGPTDKRARYTLTAKKSVEINEQHIGGTLTFDTDPKAYAITGMGITRNSDGYYDSSTASYLSGLPETTQINYYLQDDANLPHKGQITTTSAGTLKADNPFSKLLISKGGKYITGVKFPDATDTNRVVKIVFELNDGLNIAPGGGYSFSYDMKADKGLPDNTGQEGVHQTELTVTLQSDTGCSIQNGIGSDSSPVITGGEHKKTHTILIKEAVESLLIQTQGYYYSTAANYYNQTNMASRAASTTISEPMPFLSGGYGYSYFTLSSAGKEGKIATDASASLYFGYGKEGDATRYDQQPETWQVYHNVELEIGSDEDSKRYLETISAFDLQGVLYTNGRMEYSTNKVPSQRSISLGNTSSPPEADPLPTVSISSGTKYLALDKDEYLTSLTFKADVFKAYRPSWNSSVAFGSAYPNQGRWTGAGIRFYSNTDRNYRSDGTAIPDVIDDWDQTISTLKINAKIKAVEIAGSKRSIHAANGATPIVFRKALPVSVINNNGTPSITAPTSTLQQGGLLNLTLTVPKDSDRTNKDPICTNMDVYSSLQESYVWLKVNKNFAYTGTDSRIEVIPAADGGTYLKIYEPDATMITYTYPISLMALPTATLGNSSVIEGIWRTIDTGEQFTRSYGLAHSPDYQYNIGMTSTVPNPLGLGSGASTIRGVVRVGNTTLIQPQSVVGVSLLSGVDMSYAPKDDTKAWRDSLVNNLTCYASIGSDPVIDVKDYEIIFDLPQKGETGDYTLKSEESQAMVMDYGLKLRGAIKLEVGDLSPTVAYKVNGEWYSKEDVLNKGGWEKVIEVKMHFDTLPGGSNLAVILPLTTDEPASKLAAGQMSAVTAGYSFTKPGMPVSIARSNAARYQYEMYKIGSSASVGYAFNDKNQDGIFGSGTDTKRSGMSVELWASDANGKLQGIKPLATTTTDTNGFWEFDNQQSGWYVVKYVLEEKNYRFAAPGTAAGASHVDQNGDTPAFEVTGTADKQITYNAGVQAIPVLTVEFRVGSIFGPVVKTEVIDENHTTLASQVKPLPKTNATLSLGPNLTVPTHYSLRAGESSSKTYTMNWDNPTKTVVYEVIEDMYTVTATAGSNGTATPGTQQVAYNKNASTITMTPDVGYELDKVTLQRGSNEAENVNPSINPATEVGTYVVTNVAEDSEVIVTFKEKNITINYESEDADKGTVSSASESLSALSGTAQGSTATAKSGYVLTHWTDTEGNIVQTAAKETTTDTFIPKKTGELYTPQTYTAHFEAIEFTVYFDTNGGKPETIEPIQVPCGEEIMSREDFPAKGSVTKQKDKAHTYTFAGWKVTDPDPSDQTSSLSPGLLLAASDTMPDHDVYLIAEWDTKENEVEEPKISAKKKSDQKQIGPNEKLTYSIILTNEGKTKVKNITVKDYLPKYTAFVSATHGGTCSKEEEKTCVTWFIKELNPSETINLHLVLKTESSIPSGYKFENTAYYQTSDDETPISGRPEYPSNTTLTTPISNFPQTGDDHRQALLLITIATATLILGIGLPILRKRKAKK